MRYVIAILLMALSSFAAEANITFAFTTNFYSQLEPMEGDSGSVGGAARLSKEIRELRLSEDRFILLDTGNHFAGYIYGRFGGRPDVDLMNLMHYDAMLLGEEEIAMGEELFDNWGHIARFPIVASNLVAPPQCKVCRHLVPYTTTERSGIIVGVFGLLPPELGRDGRVIDEIEVEDDLLAAARQTVDILLEKCDIIVMLSQLDIEDDISIAEQVCDIDLIVSSEWGDYRGEPMLIRGDEGCNTIIGCSDGRGAMLGVLRTSWDAAGIMVSHSWEPVAIDDRVSPDPVAYGIVEAYMDSLAPAETLASMASDLDARDILLCSGESNAGNLVCDAMLDAYPDADLALLSAGSIFGNRIISGSLTDRDIKDMLPYGEDAVVMSMTGAALKRCFERSASCIGDRFGCFLQIAGGRVVIDTSRTMQLLDEGGSAVVECRIGSDEIDPEKEYTVVTGDFLARGGGGYFWMKGVPNRRGKPLSDIVVEYLRRGGAIPEFEDRIRIIP